MKDRSTRERFFIHYPSATQTPAHTRSNREEALETLIDRHHPLFVRRDGHHRFRTTRLDGTSDCATLSVRKFRSTGRPGY